MARTHIYFAIEALALTPSQRATLITALRQLGPASDPQPARLNHWRTRLDNQAAIFEGAFQDTVLTIDAMKTRLGTIFSVDPAILTHAVFNRTFDTRPTPVVTFNHGGTDRLRMAVFGGPHATWAQSRNETIAYILANHDQWEDDVP